MNKEIINDEHFSGHNPTIRIHLWLQTTEGVFFGLGRAQLLEKIDELGSLKKAAEKLGMSYRGAWGKIKKTEKILNQKLIVKVSNKEGYKLTDFGRSFRQMFMDWQSEIENFAYKRAQEIFPWPSETYESSIVENIQYEENNS